MLHHMFTLQPTTADQKRHLQASRGVSLLLLLLLGLCCGRWLKESEGLNEMSVYHKSWAFEYLIPVGGNIRKD